MALVVPDDAAAPTTPDALLTQLRDRLSSYKVPRSVFFIRAEEVPYMTSQKPDRRVLATIADELSRPGR